MKKIGTTASARRGKHNAAAGKIIHRKTISNSQGDNLLIGVRRRTIDMVRGSNVDVNKEVA